MSLPRRALLLLTSATLLITACATGGDGASGPTTMAGDDVAVFDTSVVHDVSLTFDEDDYDAMIATFTETGEKDWIEATVTIDGETYEQVGARLKGNSSLAGLGGGFGRGPAGGLDDDPATAETTPTDEPVDEGDGEVEPVPANGPSGSASAEVPEDLPWLIRLDQFVEGQDHQGYEDLVVRSNGSETSLNEAVALDLLAQAGLASQEAVAAGFTVNGSDPALRLVIEHPDDDAWYEGAFDADGALYKAESTGDWSYRGDDPAAYEDVFDQEGGSEVADLTPLIELVRFVNDSDDATFEAELPERLDVEAFAAYLAMMDLVGNFDDIDGPGNNAYLWYDAETGQFTIVPWDMNLAFGGGGFGMGGGDRPQGGPPGDGAATDFTIPEGFEPGQLPEGLELPEGVEPGQLPGVAGGRAGGGFGGSNVLVQRFHANAEFEALYQQALTDLRATLLEGGTADEILAARVQTLLDDTRGLVDADTVTSEAESIAAQFTAGG